MSLYRVHSFGLYYYSAFVYSNGIDKQTNLPIYRVEIKTSTSKIPVDIEPLYQLNLSSTKNVKIKTLTSYMKWKLPSKQKTANGVKSTIKADDNSCTFTNLLGDLPWILSILDVEFDYHVGEQNCLKRENVIYLTEYKKSKLSGYGPGFCSHDPKLNISESRLVKYIGM